MSMRLKPASAKRRLACRWKIDHLDARITGEADTHRDSGAGVDGAGFKTRLQK
jgi:hypothetical protein